MSGTPDRDARAAGTAAATGRAQTQPRTLFEKVWDAHVVRPETKDTPAVL